MIVSPNKFGIVIGAFAGLVHFTWAALVAAQLAQPFLHYILYFHFLTMPMRVEPFEFPRALILVAGTSSLGYIGGAFIAALWNGLKLSDKIRR